MLLTKFPNVFNFFLLYIPHFFPPIACLFAPNVNPIWTKEYAMLLTKYPNVFNFFLLYIPHFFPPIACLFAPNVNPIWTKE
jgi:hypothetical protein